MRNRIIKYAGVLVMLRGIVTDGDGLWNRYACDEAAESRGFEVRHFEEETVFRRYYETECRPDPWKKRIMVIDRAAFSVPEEISSDCPVADVSLHGLFPILNTEALRELPGLDYDYLAYVADCLPFRMMDRQQTTVFCLRRMYSGFYAADYGQALLEKAVHLAEKAVSRRDWIEAAMAFGKASMIQRGGREVPGFTEGQERVTAAFEAWMRGQCGSEHIPKET